MISQSSISEETKYEYHKANEFNELHTLTNKKWNTAAMTFRP